MIARAPVRRWARLTCVALAFGTCVQLAEDPVDAVAASPVEMASEVRVAEPTVHGIGFEWDMASLKADPERRFARGLILFSTAGKAPQSAPLMRIDLHGWNKRCVHQDCCSGAKADLCGSAVEDQTLTRVAACCNDPAQCTGGIQCDGMYTPPEAKEIVDALGPCEEIQCPARFELTRVDRQTVEPGYRRFNMFAGSLLDLPAATTYDVRLAVCAPEQSDSDCAEAPAAISKPLSITTLPRPRRPWQAAPRPEFHVVSDDRARDGCIFDESRSCACAREPSLEGCAASGAVEPTETGYCDGSKDYPFRGFAEADLCSRPGDVFLVHRGRYYGHVFAPSRTDCSEPAADGSFEPPDPEGYVYWIGYDARLGKEKAASAAAAGVSTGFGCPDAAKESPYRLTRVRLRPRRVGTSHPDHGVGSLVLQRDNLWFEGFDLRPVRSADDDDRDYRGMIEGIAGAVRFPRLAVEGADGRTTCVPDYAVQPFGVRNVVITRNAFTNFHYGIATGKWCSRNHPANVGLDGTETIGSSRGVSWNADARALGPDGCQDAPPVCSPGWAPGNPAFPLDRRRAHMHRHWYVGDNVFRATYSYHRSGSVDGDGNLFGPGRTNTDSLMSFTFTADSDVAFNRLSMTACRSQWTQLAKQSWKKGGLADAGPKLQCTLAPDSWPTETKCSDPGYDGKCGIDGTAWACPHQDLPSGPACTCGHAEPDAIQIFSSSNVDVYGNDARDITGDNFVHAGTTLANLRLWRNRAVNVGHNLVRMDPMQGAPWYVVRNEFVGAMSPIGFQMSDRFFLINNTFVVTGPGGQGEAEGMFGAYSRNNLWILRFRRHGSNQGGSIWSGRAKVTDATHQLGQSVADWRTDLDHDGFDWGALLSPSDDKAKVPEEVEDCERAYIHDEPGATPSCPLAVPRGDDAHNEVVYFDGYEKPWRSWSQADGFPRQARGCSSGLGVTSCSDTSPCPPPAKCVEIEPTFSRVDRAQIFALCKPDEGAVDCESALEKYRFRDRFPEHDLGLAAATPRRCTAIYEDAECGDDGCVCGGGCVFASCLPCGLEGCVCPQGGGICDDDADCPGAQCLHGAVDRGAAVPHLTSVGDDVVGLPDLGAHEYREDHRTAHYGPRTQASSDDGEDPGH